MNSQDKKESAKKIWYHFYYEPYFEREKNEEFVTLLIKYIEHKIIKDTKKEIGDVSRRIKTQLDQEKQIQPDYFPILLPFLLSHKDFYESYLHVSLPHRRYFSNSQHLLTQSLAHLRILSYPQDNFYRPFVTLTEIDKNIDEQLKNNEEIKFEQWEDVEYTNPKDIENMNKTKTLLEAKYKALWHQVYIRHKRYPQNVENNEKSENYHKEEICKHIKEGIEAIKEVEWDYDCAMLFLTLIGHAFLGIQGKCTFMDLDKDLRNTYIKYYEKNICPLKPCGDKTKNREDCNEGIKLYGDDEIKKLQSHLSHPHIALYLDYYEFLYLQMQFEHIAAKYDQKSKEEFKNFKDYLDKAQSQIDNLIAKYSAYHYFYMKFLKHRARIYEIKWHIELKILESQVQSPFDFELKDPKNSILKESDTIAKYIDSFFGNKK